MIVPLILAVALSAAYAQDAQQPAPSSTATPATTAPVDQAAAKPKDATKAKAVRAGQSAKPLNLATPDITTVVSPDELKEPLPDPEQQAQVEEDQTVAVKANENAPYVLGGFGALWWAMKHPSQAWRILTPIE